MVFFPLALSSADVIQGFGQPQTTGFGQPQQQNTGGLFGGGGQNTGFGSTAQNNSSFSKSTAEHLICNPANEPAFGAANHNQAQTQQNNAFGARPTFGATGSSTFGQPAQSEQCRSSDPCLIHSCPGSCNLMKQTPVAACLAHPRLLLPSEPELAPSASPPTHSEALSPPPSSAPRIRTSNPVLA